MAVGTGYSKVATTGLVFAYDTADTYNSYKGEPTTNLVISPDGNANVITTDVPPGVNVVGYAQYSSGYYVNPRNTTNVSATGNTFTYSVYMRSTSVPKSTYLMYVYTGTGPDGGWWYFGDGNLTSDWQRYTYTRSDLTGTVSIVTVYRYNQQGTIDIAAPQIEIKPHATQFVKGTRSNTQGLLDVSGRGNTFNLTNMSYDANANFFFDGTDDYINAGTINLQQDWTLEAICYMNSDSSFGIFGQGIFNTNQGLHILYQNNSRGMIFGMYANDNDYGNNYRPITGRYYHWVFTYSAFTYTKQFYADTVLQTAPSPVQNIYQGSGQFNIGAIFSSAGSSANGRIPVAKMYNRVLTAAEVRDNYFHYKTRFGLP